jgi:NADH-quinone oxidoreductase subunit N
MLAYSTIAHIGFLLLGLLPGSAEGFAATLFYAITYAITTTAAFGMLLLLSHAGFEAEKISDFAGLFRRSPWFALVMLIVLFSLAGVPPAVGFYAKLSVLAAAVEAGFVWIAALAVLFSVIGAFYYLRVVKTMFFDPPAEAASVLDAGFGLRAALSINGLAVLGLGLYPAALMAACLIATTG